MTTTTGIRFNHVAKSFWSTSGELKVFEDIDFSIDPGQFVTLVGTSGCGKTTLLNMAAGFDTPTAGEVSVGTKMVTGPSRDRGVVFQQYAVFPWMTVRQNIEFPLTIAAATPEQRAEKAEIVDRYIMAMGLERFADHLPKQLSGGMKQRVAIGRTYAANPATLLMDEPFAALDAQSRENMQEILVRISRGEGKTVLLVTHSVEEAIFLSDRIIVLAGRPSAIAGDFTIDFPPERDAGLRLTDEFLRLRREIEGILHAQSNTMLDAI